MKRISEKTISLGSLCKSIKHFSNDNKMHKFLKQFSVKQWTIDISLLAYKEREDALLYLLSNPAHELTEASINYILETNEDWVLPLLIKAYEQGGKKARLESIKILRKKQDPQTTDFLLEVLKGKEWKIKRHAALTLGQIGDHKAIPFVESMLNSKDWRLRRGACDALRSFHDPEARSVLHTVLNDRDWRVRRGAVRAWVELDQKREKAGDILPKLQDKDWRVRILTAELLGFYPQPQVWQALINALGDLPITSVVAETLTKIGQQTVPDLITALNQPKKSIVLGAVQVLGDLAAVEALPALEKAAHDRDYGIQEKAREAIIKI